MKKDHCKFTENVYLNAILSDAKKIKLQCSLFDIQYCNLHVYMFAITFNFEQYLKCQLQFSQYYNLVCKLWMTDFWHFPYQTAYLIQSRYTLILQATAVSQNYALLPIDFHALEQFICISNACNSTLCSKLLPVLFHILEIYHSKLLL